MLTRCRESFFGNRQWYELSVIKEIDIRFNRKILIMRKYIYIFCCILLTACDSLLDVVPENASTIGNFFKDEKELESITTEMHSIVKSYFVGDNAHIYMGMIADKTRSSDELRNLSAQVLDEGSMYVNWKFPL